MSLPDEWLETSAPGKLPVWKVVSGRTFQRRYQLQNGFPLAGTDLTGCTVAASISDRQGNTLVITKATIIAPLTGWIKVTITPTETGSIQFPTDHAPKSNCEIIGRADIVITDGSNLVSIGMADVELVRGEAA